MEMKSWPKEGSFLHHTKCSGPVREEGQHSRFGSNTRITWIMNLFLSKLFRTDIFTRHVVLHILISVHGIYISGLCVSPGASFPVNSSLLIFTSQVVNGEDDFKWGVVVNFQKKANQAKVSVHQFSL